MTKKTKRFAIFLSQILNREFAFQLFSGTFIFSWVKLTLKENYNKERNDMVYDFSQPNSEPIIDIQLFLEYTFFSWVKLTLNT